MNLRYDDFPRITCCPCALLWGAGACSEARLFLHFRKKLFQTDNKLVGRSNFPDVPVSNVGNRGLAAPHTISDRFLGHACCHERENDLLDVHSENIDKPIHKVNR